MADTQKLNINQRTDQRSQQDEHERVWTTFALILCCVIVAVLFFPAGYFTRYFTTKSAPADLKTIAYLQAERDQLQVKLDKIRQDLASTPANPLAQGQEKQPAPQSTTVHVEKGNSLSLIAWDLFPNLTDGCKTPRQAYVDVAAAATGDAIPNPNDPDKILADKDLVLPAVITVCGVTKTANIERAQRRAESRGVKQTVATAKSQFGASQANAPIAKSPTTSHVNGFAQIAQPLTGAVMASLNLQTDVPMANISAFGTIGEHAPPTSGNNALRKENFQCGNCG